MSKLYFASRDFVIEGVNKAVDSAATAALVVAGAAAFDVISLYGWVELGKVAALGALVSVLRHFAHNGPTDAD